MAIAGATSDNLRPFRIIAQLLPDCIAVGEIKELLGPDVTASRREQNSRRRMEDLGDQRLFAIYRSHLVAVRFHALLQRDNDPLCTHKINVAVELSQVDPSSSSSGEMPSGGTGVRPSIITRLRPLSGSSSANTRRSAHRMWK
jgi:hypothetical protein